MHNDREQVIARCRRVLTDRLLPSVHRARVPVEVDAWVAPGEPVPFGVASGADYQPFPVGSRWGAPWGTTWFRGDRITLIAYLMTPEA